MDQLWLILPAWFDHLEESFSNNLLKVQFKVYPPVKHSCPPAENINETLLIL